jgi:UDP-N-acetylglucosamine--N-acetylmuramyl-(pentapeptide) pyrophosphoryl-undecaprenol N-acetylglucosamine transferase
MVTGPILLAAGGTGGHVFPAEALARTLAARTVPVALVTDPRGRAWGDRLPDVPIHRIRARQAEAGLAGKLRTLSDLAFGTLDARGLLRRLKPSVVVGFGGYAAAPTLFAARFSRVPIAIHEQNAVLGRVNGWFAGKAALVATAFASVAGVPAGARVVRTGNPVRPAIAAVAGSPYAAPQPDGPFRLLVLGGSQGARIFSTLVPEAVAALPPSIRAQVAIAQQCRPEDLEECRARWAATGVEAELSSFFDDVPRRLVEAHLVICRSGASTVAELAAVGRPSILVPYPFAAEDHQTANARAYAASGAATLMPQEGLAPAALAAALADLYTRPSRLEGAARAAAEAARPDAADRLADAVMALADAASTNRKERP